MRIQQKRLEMQRVIKIRAEEKIENVLDMIKEIKEALLSKNLYSTSPIVFQYSKEAEVAKLDLYLQLNREFKIESNEQISYMDSLVYENCLYARYLPEEYTGEIMENILQNKAKEDGFTIDSLFYVIIPIPGGRVMDIYAPIRQGEKS
ncbi:MAG: hypothetical protein RR746_08560 [Lachnospiraceae bacterium]